MAVLVRIIPVRLSRMVESGDDLAGMICGAARIADGDVLVVAQKAVSKCEGMEVRLDSVEPSLLARGISGEYGKDPRVTELVLREAAGIVRMESGIIITETARGHVCANSGVDLSNVRPGHALLLPRDCDASAARLRGDVEGRCGARVGVIISDTAGRPFRKGQTDVALGCSGAVSLRDYAGTSDVYGRVLRVTLTAVADQLAGAAEIVMGKTRDTPAAIIRGAPDVLGEGSASDIIRRSGDLFR